MGQTTKNLDNFVVGNKIIEKMASINITGNIIPMIWFKKILYPSGKPNLLAINILADIVYWYRPTEIRDEKTGEIIAYKKKFSADLLQRNYEQISKMFGCSKREATNAIICLENLGLIKRIFRTINDNGLIMSNVLFLELNPDKVLEITYRDLSISETVDNTNQSGGCHFQKGEGSLLKVGGVSFKSETYTENTTKNKTDISLKKEMYKERNEERVFEILSNKKSKNLTSGSQEILPLEVKKFDRNNNNNNNNISLKKEIYKERNEEKCESENETNKDSNLPCTENSDMGKTVHGNSDNKNGNSKNSKRVTTNNKVGSKTLNSVIQSYTNNEEMQELLAEFIEIRAKMKKPLTPNSLKRNLKVLDRASLENGGDGTDEEKIKIIERTVINSWQSFYSLNSNVHSSPVMKKVHRGGYGPSYDLEAYEKWDGINAGKKKNKDIFGNDEFMTLDELERKVKEERNKNLIEINLGEEGSTDD